MKSFLVFLISLVASSAAYSFQATPLNDDQIRQQIIQQSISQYRGSCPCPFSVARNGSSCGGRSAYSRAGGYQPKCYPKDVSAAEIRLFRGAK